MTAQDDALVAFKTDEVGIVPTPKQLAVEAVAAIWFEWYADRTRVEEAIAAAIEKDRARTRAVVGRLRVLLPGLLRDLDKSLGGRA